MQRSTIRLRFSSAVVAAVAAATILLSPNNWWTADAFGVVPPIASSATRRQLQQQQQQTADTALPFAFPVLNAQKGSQSSSSSKLTTTTTTTTKDKKEKPKYRTWDESYQLLKQFKEKYGHCNVNQRYKNDPKLGRWVDSQRKRYRKGLLPEEKTQKLNDVEFIFNPRSSRFAWSSSNGSNNKTFHDWYTLLEEYYHQHGDSHVPAGYILDGEKLGDWVYVRRKCQAYLSTEKRRQLDKLQFCWKNPKPIKSEQRWTDMFERLQNYKQRYGDCLVPRNWKDDQQLGSWVSRQRWFRNKGLLSETRIQKLESISFVWRLRDLAPYESEIFDRRWHEQYQKVIAFKEENGHTRIPGNFPRDTSLGAWVMNQRKAYSKGLLRKDRRKLLDKIGFSWSFEEEWNDAWEAQYEGLRVHIAEHSSIDNLCVLNYSVYGWLQHQFRLDARGRLDPERKAKLDELGVDWRIRGE